MNDEKPQVGFIGLGLMGSPIALALCEAGYPVNVWGRRAHALEPLAAAGAQICASPADVASASSLVLLCVTDAKAVEAVVFGESGLALGCDSDSLVIDHSSISPAATKAIAARLRDACGASWLDAPVTGGPPAVAEKRLVVMAGGSSGDFARSRSVVETYAGRFTLLGETGAGQSTKLINQALAGANFALVAEVTRMAMDAGIDASALPAALAGGRADSSILQEYMPRMARGDFEPMGTVNVILKDLRTVLDVAAGQGNSLPLTALAAQIHQMAVAQGLGTQDNGALIKLYGQE